jgi:imidazolonepropionase-like amidohydrolase
MTKLLPRGALAAPAVVLAFAAALPSQDLLVQAREVVVAPDMVLRDGVLLVRQGKVAYVGDDIPAEARSRAISIDYGDAVVVPGFVLAQSTLGQDRDLAESAFAFTPDLRVSEAFDPWQEELAPLPRCGITSLALSPSARNVAGGISALVKPGRAGGAIVVPELHLSLSLTQAARSPERQPTSLMGAVDLLRTTFAAARTGTQTGPDAAVLRQVLQRSRAVFVHADTYTELSAALDLSKEFGLEPTIVGGREAEKVLARLVQQKASIVLETLTPEARLQQLRLPTVLAEAGVPFCFGGQPDQLRLSAALAVRHGLDRKTALSALTRMPAMLLDQQALVGSLRQACAADFLVFRGDPLDLDSTHVATWIDGVRVHGEAPAPAKKVDAPATLAGER